MSGTIEPVELCNLLIYPQIEFFVSSNRRGFAVLVEDEPIDLEHVLLELMRSVPIIVVVIDTDDYHSTFTPDFYGEGSKK